MNIAKKFLSLFVIVIFITQATIAQRNPVSSIDSVDKKLINWYNLDYGLNGVPGASVDKAYQKLLSQKRPEKKIIVAVIDGGVDFEHPDLKGKIWTNNKEIADNSLDDDNNGYVDDVHGWNFIGNSKNENIEYENMEYTRIYKKLNPIFKDYKSSEVIPANQQNNYKMYLDCKELYFKTLNKYEKRKQSIKNFEFLFNDAQNILKSYSGKNKITKDDLFLINSSQGSVVKARNFLINIYKNGFDTVSLKAIKKSTDEYIDKYLNLEFDPRKIISDNLEDINDKSYGNNDIKGPDSFHGTFVAGIIGATRDNNIGINGIADNVEIMSVRVVPNGDERDKDVALAIRYAVDNGANIINMSFGKAYSPQKKLVDDAIKYAEVKNVLIIHAAGNEAVDIDKFDRYPSPRFSDGTSAKNVITVGAITMKPDKTFCAVYTNYGRNGVDLFAPGSAIVSLYPGNKYLTADGTSFSCPVVVGVAALVLSYYPELSASELKNIILTSCTTYPKLKVYYPNLESSKNKKTKFYKLSVTGGVVNAYNALLKAEEFSKQKKLKE